MFKQTTEYKSIQKKLVAAVAMVLVAAVMVVSSSYAWFTLSTAPEVKGIQTSVGSNGNLEMALRKTGLALDQITSLTSGGNSFPAANTTWGNLVDLRNHYGLEEISLAPARLNASQGSISGYEIVTVPLDDVTGYTASDSPAEGQTNKYEVNGVVYDITSVTRDDAESTTDFSGTVSYQKPVYSYKVNSQRILMTPTYGPDGRVSAIEGNTDIGYYQDGKWVMGTAGTDLGVLALGTVSGLSDAEIALRKAKDTVYKTIVQVQGDASTSLSVNAGDIANMMVSYYLNEGVMFTNVEYDKIAATLTKLNALHDSLKNALDQAVIAVGVYQSKTVTTVTWNGADIVTNATSEIDWEAEGLAAPYASLKNAYDDLADLKATLTSCVLPARQEGTGSYKPMTTDGDTSGLLNAVSPLVDTNDLLISVGGQDYDIDEFQQAAYDNVGAIIAGGGITVKVVGGIYADIAKFVGNYEGTAEVVAPAGAIPGVNTEMKVPATMKTVVNTPTGGFYLVYANAWLPQLVLTNQGGGEASSLTDLYGYMIDFAFRTNAVNSSLMLQSSAVDRVNNSYGEESVTQGAGSYMQFTIGSGNDYTLTQMVELMKAIRIVFVDENFNIVGVAALDVAYQEVFGTGEAAPEAYDFTVVNDETTRYYKFDTASLSEDDTTVTASINLYDFSFDTTGIMVLGNKIAPNASGATALMELIQNQAAALSTIVYLDGDQVDNGDVAINGDSMTGTMNLQFSSSATLVPMDYTFTDTAVKLDTPDIDWDPDTQKLTITPVANAAGYKLYYNGVEVPGVTLQAGVNDLNTYVSGLTAGDYVLSVVAVPATDSTEYANSDPATFTIELTP